jgi:Protein of unknown function (DUF2628)
MARTYTLHVPAGAEPGDAEALEDAELVRDGFSWGAFLFTFLWFFWNRLWLAGIGVLIAIIGLPVALQALHVDPGAAVLAEVLLSLLIGLEANSLRRWTLRRRKPAVDVVTASDLEEAEAKAFSRWLENAGDKPRPRVSASFPASAYRRPEPVIGLFPETERPR